MQSSPESITTGTQVDIVVVSFRRRDLLRRCLVSIGESNSDRVNFTTHLIDNASGDGTAAMVRSEFPDVQVLEQAENDGFAIANNRGLEECRSGFVLLLNPDTELRPGVVEQLLTDFEMDSSIGMLGCRLEQLDGTFDHASKRQFPSPADALRHFFTVSRQSRYLAPHVLEREFGYVDAVNGAFMLVKREALESVGGLDEKYWMYGEDLDWCHRFWDAGWKVAYEGRKTAIHVKGGSSGKVRAPKLNWHFHRSMYLFYKDYNSGKNRVLDVATYSGIWVHALAQYMHYWCARIARAMRSESRGRGRVG